MFSLRTQPHITDSHRCFADFASLAIISRYSAKRSQFGHFQVCGKFSLSGDANAWLTQPLSQLSTPLSMGDACLYPPSLGDAGLFPPSLGDAGLFPPS